MGGKFEIIKQGLSDIRQRFVEFIGLEPPFRHNTGCSVRGGLKRTYENLIEENKISVTRTCGACGSTDNFKENNIDIVPRSGW